MNTRQSLRGRPFSQPGRRRGPLPTSPTSILGPSQRQNRLASCPFQAGQLTLVSKPLPTYPSEVSSRAALHQPGGAGGRQDKVSSLLKWPTTPLLQGNPSNIGALGTEAGADNTCRTLARGRVSFWEHPMHEWMCRSPEGLGGGWGGQEEEGSGRPWETGRMKPLSAGGQGAAAQGWSHHR